MSMLWAGLRVETRLLCSRVRASLVERARGFNSYEAADFLSGEIPAGVTVPGLDYTVEDLEPVCPKCPHWRHTGDRCAACSCVSIFWEDGTFETGSPTHPTASAPTCPQGAVDETGAVLPPSAPASLNVPVQLGSQRGISPGEVSADPPDPAPSPGHSTLLRKAASLICSLQDHGPVTEDLFERLVSPIVSQLHDAARQTDQ